MKKEDKMILKNIPLNVVSEGLDKLAKPIITVNIETGKDLNDAVDINQVDCMQDETNTGDVIKLLANQEAKSGTSSKELDDSKLLSQRDTGHQGNHNMLSKEVYDNLPDLLKGPCSILTSKNEREVLLIGALGVISGVLPNYRAYYRGKEIEANLYCYVLAPYGVGKGSLEYAKKLVEPIHQQKRYQFVEEQEQYKVDSAHYEKSLKLFERDRKAEIELPDKPTPPSNYMLMIPANNSKTGLYQILNENKGRGILFETEGDTLADSVKQDYGNFSDGLRKAFHHETISFFRRANSEYVEIAEPFLSVILSSTQDQLQKLIPSPENGLFSRFMYYELQPNNTFDNVFDKTKNGYNEHFKEWSVRLKDIYNMLESSETSFWFELQEHQERRFLEIFQNHKDEFSEFISRDMEGTVNRLGLICFRIAMVLSALREFDKFTISKKVVCSDQDFDNAIRIINILKAHSLSVYWKLKKSNEKVDEMLRKLKTSDPDREKFRQVCIDLYNNGMSVRKISRHIYGSESKKSTVYRWIHEVE